MQVKESDVFFARVWSAIEKGGKDLLWLSESDRPLTAIKIGKVDFMYEKATGAKWTKEKYPRLKLLTLKHSMPGKRWAKGWERLMNLFVDEKDIAIYKVPVQTEMEEDLGQTPVEFRLYVLRDMGFYKVGFFTTIIET